MNKKLKKLLCGVISAAMVSASVVLPTTAGAEEFTPLVAGDTVVKEWKFDFGAVDSTPEDGYTLVTPETNFVTNKSDDVQFGFLGTGEEDYKLTERYDGWKTQKGQVIELASGGGTGLNDAVGVIGAGGKDENAGKDIFGNQADVYYPTRFAMKVQDETYYRVKATVTTLDPAKDATVSLYTERKHPLYTNKTLSAGTTDTLTFSVRVTPIYYEKSTPTGAIADEMLTVGVLGENSALASLEIQQVESIPTIWVLGDSTVTDGGSSLPFWQRENYTGVGTGLTKYLPREIAMVNEGEGGLNAYDSNHFNMVKSRIKAGDYMYVEYGHNHKAPDTPAGYKSALDKYYDACHAVGAKLIVVSPVQSVNSWNETTSRWNDRFGGEDNFEGAGKSYVAEKVAAGATDVAFANLTKTSVAFIDKVTEDNSNSKEAAMFYYQVPKGANACDASHPNDIGAENFAYCFFDALKDITDETQKAAIQPLLDGMTTELPNPVSAEVITAGLDKGWPQYIIPTTEKYPVVIDDVVFNEDGTVKQVDVTTRAAEIQLTTYGAIIITIYNADGTEKGKLYAINQVDNSTGYGPQTISAFSGNTILEEGDTFSAVVVEADADVKPVEDGKVYSAVYTPTDIVNQYLLNEDKDGSDNFDYFGKTYDGATDQLNGINGWRQIGSAGITSYLNEENGVKYVELTSDGSKNGTANQGSFYFDKTFDGEIGTTGRYMISADIQYVSGGGMTFNLVTGHSDKKLGGAESLYLFTIADNGDIMVGATKAGTVSATSFTNVQYILDMDLAEATVTISGSDPVTVKLGNYDTTSIDVTPSKLTQFMFGGNKVVFDNKIANLQVASLKDKVLPEYTFTVISPDIEKGTVELTYATPTPEPTEETPATEETSAAGLMEAETVTLSYNGKALITSSGALTAVLFDVTYEDGKLADIKMIPVEMTEAGTKEFSVTEGNRLMLWKDTDTIVPLTEAIDAVIPLVPDEKTETLALNTVVTAKAQPKVGYVFMGWKNESGSTVSTDSEYTLRLRGNTKLTANFVKEPGVEDVASFGLSADKTSIKAAAGTVVNISVIDAADAAGTPIASVTESDGTWTCDDTGITVTNGVMTIPDGYTSDAAKKTVTVTCAINGVSNNIKIKMYAADYYEDFSTISSVADWITDTSSAPLSAIIDTATDKTFTGMTAAGNGKALVIGNGGSGDSSKLEYTRDMGLSDKSVLKFGFDIEPNQIRNDGKNAAVTLQFVDSEGTAVFNISVHTGGKDSSFNGTAVKGFTQGTVVSVDTELDFTNKKMKYTLTNPAGTVLASGESNLTANNLDKMYFSGSWNYGKFAIDNVYADYAE